MSQSNLTNKSKSEGGSRRARIPPVKVKRVLQSDEDIGKMSNAVPIVFAKLLEHFIEQVLLRTDEVANSFSVRTLSTTHMKLAAEREPSLNFLLPLFAGVTGFPPSDFGNDAENRCHSKPRPTAVSIPNRKNRAIGEFAESLNVLVVMLNGGINVRLCSTHPKLRSRRRLFFVFADGIVYHSWT
uniref:CBFD_NFYB_HMF domain-containing protein n=1 Tax=Trichuris muris TaxID=70415 RepID=A0A5S6R555_TRIMR